MNRPFCGLAVLTIAVISALHTAALGQEPLGYRGINSSGIYPAEGLADSWSQDGPPLAWRYEVGVGYAGVTVADEKVFIAGGLMSHLYIFSMEGKLLERHPIAGAGWKRFGGTRSTPLVSGRTVVTTTPDAGIHAFDLKTKKTRWNVNAWKSFGAGKGHMGWGYPESPVLHDGKVIFNTTSRMDETPPFVAVDIKTGNVVWKTPARKDNKDYYSGADVSPALFNHNGRDLIFYPTWRYVTMLDADTGRKLWEIRKVGEKTLTPIYSDGYLLYGRGGAIQMLKLSRNGEKYEVLWERRWPGGYAHGVILDGRVYTIGNPHETAYEPNQINEPLNAPKKKRRKSRVKRGTGLLCLDAETGKLLQSEPASNNRGHVIAADGKIIYTELVRQSGSRTPIPRVSLAVPTKDGFKITGRFVPEMSPGELSMRDIDWQASANPVVAKGRLFLRYGPLMVFELRADKMAAIRKARAEVGRYVKDLDSDDAETRLKALKKIAEAGPAARSAMDALLQGLTDPSAEVRKQAAEMLGKLGPMAAPSLVRALTDETVWKQGHAGKALTAAVPKADTLAEAIALTGEATTDVRDEAATLLPKLGKEAVAPMLAIMKRARRRGRWWSIEVLSRVGPPAAPAVNALIGIIRTNNQWFRAHAAEALGNIGPAAEEAVPALVTLLSDGYPNARQQAAIALGRIGVSDRKVLAALKKTADDSNEKVAAAAEKAIAELKSD
ncbi:MAG: HEAT repeat domain-containing protein [Planctomycetota bacterium]